MSSSPLNYNQYAAQALWGSSSTSGNSSLLSIIKSNMLDKANSLNKSLISRYESQASELTNKIGHLDNLKSQLATLSTKAQNLTGLKNRVNANINVSSGSSSLVTITNDFIIKGQAARPAGVSSKNTSAVTVGNYEGTFEAGDYTIKVNGNAVYAVSSDIGFDKIKFSASQLGSQKISELAGYNIQSGGETVTVQVGSNSAATINVNKDTTVNQFLNQLSGLNGITTASIGSNGNISIEMNTDLGYQSLSFSSSNESGRSVLDVLGLGNITGKLNDGTIDTLTFQGFHTNFEEVGITGNFNLAFNISADSYTSSVNTTIGGKNIYGDEITGTSRYGGDPTSLISTTIVNQDSIEVKTSLYSFTDTYYRYQLHTNLDVLQSDIDLSISNHYDMSNYTMEVTLDESQLDKSLSKGTTYSYIDKSGVTHGYTVQARDTVSKVLSELGLLTGNRVNITNIEGRNIDNAFLTDLLGVDFNTPSNSPEVIITFNAKEGDNAPPQISNKLTDYSYSSEKPSEKISIGDLVITIDGVDNRFVINNDTTVQDFKTFMATLGFTYDPSTRDFVGGQNGRKIDVSGSSTITGIINPVISEYQYNVTIKKDKNGNYYKNLYALSGVEGDGTIKINENTINIRQSWSINDLISVINGAEAGVEVGVEGGVEASFSNYYNKLKITRTDGYLSYIDFKATDSNSQILLSNLNFITQNIDLSYNTNKNNQYLPDGVLITVTKDDKTYNIGNITSSNNEFGRSFATIVKNMSANDSNVMLGSFNIDISKLGEHIVTVNEATAAIPDITVANLSGATNYIEMVEKIGTLTSNNYNLKITKISDTQMQISRTDNNGNDLGTKIIEKEASDDKFYYTISQYDENGKEKGSVTFEVKNDDFNIGDNYTRTTNVKIEATTSEGGSLDGIDDVINSVNEQIDENNKKIINEFVSVYNNVAKEMSKINKLSSSSTSYSDKLTISELMKSFNNTINQVDTTYGSTIGLTFSYDSNLNTSVLKLDTDKFLSALDTNTETVTNYLSKVSEKITSSIDLFVKSKFASMYSTSNLKLDEYNNKISSLKSKNDELMTKLEADYKLIEQLFNQSSNQYSELFSALL